MTVYLLHFDSPISPNHTTQHYLGFAEELWPRLYAHYYGYGARLTQVAKERGISWKCVRVWQGSRRDERRLKKQKNAPRFCPICNRQPVQTGLEEIEL